MQMLAFVLGECRGPWSLARHAPCTGPTHPHSAKVPRLHVRKGLVEPRELPLGSACACMGSVSKGRDLGAHPGSLTPRSGPLPLGSLSGNVRSLDSLVPWAGGRSRVGGFCN